MTSKDLGLIGKYRVERVDGKPVDWCFVLQDTDPLAIPALQAYSQEARRKGYGPLADDLDAKLIELRERHPYQPYTFQSTCAICETVIGGDGDVCSRCAQRPRGFVVDNRIGPNFGKPRERRRRPEQQHPISDSGDAPRLSE